MKIYNSILGKLINNIWDSVGSRYDTGGPETVFHYRSTDGGIVSFVGPNPVYTYTGDQYVDGISVGDVPAVTSDGVWIGPGYTNSLSSGVDNITTWTQRGTTVADNGNGSYRVTLGSAGAKDIFTNSSSLAAPHVLSIMVKRVSGSNYIKLNDSNGNPYQTEDLFVIGDDWQTIQSYQLGTGNGLFLFSGEAGVDIEVDLKFPMSVNGSLLFPEVSPTISVASAASNSSDNGIYFLSNAKMVEATSSVCTLSSVITVGASSDQISTNANIVSLRDEVTDVLYLSADGKIKANDGTNICEVSVSGGWGIGDTLNISLITASDSSQMKIGYKKNNEPEYTYGDVSTYAGSFSPESKLRFGFDLSYPIWIKEVSITNVGF